MILSVKLNEGIGLTSREVVNEEEVAILDIINSHHHANYVIGYARDINNQFIFDFVALDVYKRQILFIIITISRHWQDY